ncbi:beta-lactamase [Colletotrichum graminicola]|uniref:Beta-lactamase n=1 Tax=Colletotrichum graminicola (strain M1.001 / M2 / FGSC 10212) TaxID=645133 RepID=E3Q5S0_COLGM|nr:beta-lactamase [Colletotrichum graminicola M1.001]EFQ26168.1 beta-lactamase [Colletotrichum graminicola M1.001]WDK13941.1 beta-lactamase [Colletotrichum graminicola]
MVQVNGRCDPKFQGVSKKFQELLESGQELGASLTVKIDGEQVVNIWGGYADAKRTRPWNEDTIVNVFSTTKTISALAVLLLINDGELSPYDKVSKYWPEFAVNGKENIEVRHLLSHTSGLAVFEDPITMQELCDFDATVSRLEKQPPRWEPGTASGYHTWTYGYLIGELVRRKTGLTLREFVAQKIAAPLNADFQIGAKEEDWPRIAELVPPPLPPANFISPPKVDPDSMSAKMMNPTPDASFAHTELWRRADIGAANGHSNSQAIAKIWSRALTVADESQRLLSKETIDLIFTEQSYGPDLCFGIPIRFGTGLGIRGNGDAVVDSWIPEGRLCFWGGWGGSIIINDVDRHITIAYAMNKMDPGTAGNGAVRSYVAEIYKALGVPISNANGKP